MKNCIICQEPQNLEDFDERLDIPKIMKAEGLCFRCAYWKMRFREMYGVNAKLPSLSYVDNLMPSLRFTLDPIIRGITKDYERVTLHIDKPNPIRLNQYQPYLIQGQYDKYLVNVKRVTYQGIISPHLRPLFIPNLTLLDNLETIKLIDLNSTVIKDNLYYIIYD